MTANTPTESEANTTRNSAEETPQTLAPIRASTTPLPSPELPPNGHFIGGAFVPSDGTATIAIENPATETTLCATPDGTATDVDAAVTAARRAFPAWSHTTPKHRSEVLLTIADRIAQHHATLEQIEAANTGKPDAVSADDIASAVDTFRFAAGACRTLTTIATAEYTEGHTSTILREPLGVVGVITPWNYPLLMAAWKIAPILAAGNTLVLKPSEQTPLSTLKLAELVADILPPGVFNVITGHGDTVGQRLAEHPDIDLVALTGSVASGQKVASTASATLKRVHLELGGKAPVVVFPDADLQAVATGMRSAAFWNAGQECGAACRILVHESVADELTRLLVAEVSSLSIGGPGTGDDTEVGPMISRAHYDRVQAALDRAAAAGHNFATGGSALPGTGFFIAPTVVTNVPAGSEIARSEIFGPVISVETFSTEEEAFARANETRYGLAASVWTSDATLSATAPKRLDFGTVWVNTHLVLATEMPWGGFKGSGYGRDLSLFALDDFSRTKHVMTSHGS